MNATTSTGRAICIPFEHSIAHAELYIRMLIRGNGKANYKRQQKVLSSILYTAPSTLENRTAQAFNKQ